MKLVICGSTAFRKQKVELVQKLFEMGIEGIIDPWTVELSKGENPELLKQIQREHFEAKKQYGFIKWYHKAIVDSDGILVYNSSKNGIDGYIGANSFLEIFDAYIGEKKIFLYFNLPQQDYIRDELLTMESVVINGDLNKIK